MSQLTSVLSADLIVAVATAPGMGGVGMVRLSGPNALEVGQQITNQPLPYRQAVLTRFTDPATGELLDQGLALSFAHGQSFTGEEVVELHAHGSPVVLAQIVEACCFLGARIARPGEFSERAFSNQKMDLAQAEAIADLIASGSKAAAKAAARSLSGEFSRRIFQLSEDLEVLRVFVEAVIDFPEEEVEHLERGQIRSKINAISTALEQLLSDAKQGQLVNNGATIALVGPPNAGKSSLLNVLSGEEQAIVTDIPGTTRDALKVDLVLDGVPIKVIDTAGLRMSEDPVEKIGMERTRREASKADVLLVVLDVGAQANSKPANGLSEWIESQLDTLDLGVDWRQEAESLIVVLNKMDLAIISESQVREHQSRFNHLVAASVKYDQGISQIQSQILKVLGRTQEEIPFTARARHVESLQRSSTQLQQASINLESGVGAELVAEELKAAHISLGEIVGETTADALLGRIFSEFCIGK